MDDFRVEDYRLMDIDGGIEYTKDDITIVIPTKEEEEAIGLVLDELFSYGFKRENILVVDAGSKDSTLDIVKSRRVNYVIQNGRGKADAILSAVKYVKTPYMLVMDGDYTYDPKYIDEMIKYVPDYVEVIGYRKYGSKLLGRLHRFGNWVLTKVFNLLFGTNLNDVCSGMYLVRTDIVKNLVGRARNFSIEAEIAAAASQEGNITEVPINFRERIGKRKLSTFKDGISILFNIILLSWWYNPIFVMFFLGSLLLIPGIGIALWVLYEYLFLGIKHYVWGLIAVAGGTAGLISFMLAILSLYIKRVERRIIANLKDLERRLREEE